MTVKYPIFNYLKKVESAILNVSFRVLSNEKVRDEDTDRLLETFAGLKEYMKEERKCSKK